MRFGRAAWLAAGMLAVPAGLVAFAALVDRRIAAAFPKRGRVLELGGERVHVVEAGAGPAIVLVHGLRGNLGMFSYGLIDALARDHRVVAIDRPGSGHSVRAPGRGAGLRVQGDTVARVIAALGLERPLVVGHSLGGAVALATALDHPERVGGLALIAPLTQVVHEPPSVFRLLVIGSPLLRAIAAWTVSLPLAILQRREAMAVVFGPEAMPADFATKGGGLWGLRPQSFVGASTDMMAVGEDQPGLIARYGELRTGVGVLFGTGDRVVDPSHGRRLGGVIEGIEIETIEGAGHMLPVTRVAEVAAFVRRQAERMVA